MVVDAIPLDALAARLGVRRGAICKAVLDVRRTKAKVGFWRLFRFRHRLGGYRRGEDPRRMPGFSPGPREAFGALAWRFQIGDRAGTLPHLRRRSSPPPSRRVP